MTRFITKPAHILLLALLASVISLGAVFIAQYVFGLTPCELCLLQRIPYAVIIVLAFLGLWKQRYQKLIIIVVGLTFLVGSGIASYHTGVEKHWIQGPTACTDTPAPADQSMDDFLTKLQKAPVVACDQPAWIFHGITMASMNAVWSFVLAVFVFAALQQFRERKLHA